MAGTAEAVKKAKELILELIDQTKSKHNSSHYVEIPRSKRLGGTCATYLIMIFIDHIQIFRCVN